MKKKKSNLKKFHLVAAVLAMVVFGLLLINVGEFKISLGIIDIDLAKVNGYDFVLGFTHNKVIYLEQSILNMIPLVLNIIFILLVLVIDKKNSKLLYLPIILIILSSVSLFMLTNPLMASYTSEVASDVFVSNEWIYLIPIINILPIIPLLPVIIKKGK